MVILFSVIHSLYIIYVLNYYKTNYSFAHPITYFNNSLLYHPIGKSNIPSSKVCKLGNMLSWYLALFILIRGFLIYNKQYSLILKRLSLLLLIIGVTMSMLNLNVVIYLIPHFIIEILYQKNYIYY
jgi:hypothetical protein